MTMDLDKLVHQPTRLQLFAYLYRHDASTFTQLQAELDLTEGNLSSHLGTMEEAGAVAVEKEFVDRRPQTTYELTDDGETLFEDHVQALESLLDDVAE